MSATADFRRLRDILTSVASRANSHQAGMPYDFRQEPRQIRRVAVCTRVVGWLFLHGYVPDKLIVHANPMATANNIAASEALFRARTPGRTRLPGCSLASSGSLPSAEGSQPASVAAISG
jgi:hypothetical protein